jgi:hypothetical protein
LYGVEPSGVTYVRKFLLDIRRWLFDILELFWYCSR